VGSGTARNTSRRGTDHLARGTEDAMIERTRRDEGLERTLYGSVMEQFDRAADLMDLDRWVRRIPAKTMNEVVVPFPVKLDDGRLEMFTGYHIQHNTPWDRSKVDCGFIPTWIESR